MLQQYDQNNHPVMHIAVKKYPAGKAAISASTCASLVGDRVRPHSRDPFSGRVEKTDRSWVLVGGGASKRIVA